jgi:transcription elongation factor GreA
MWYKVGPADLSPAVGMVVSRFISAGVIMPKAMTEEIKKKLRDELNTLEHELAYDIPRELKKAVALGDLSENAEYHTAKQRQEYLKARVRQLGKRLADLSLINMNNIPKDKVGLGSTVTIFDGTKNEEMEYKLVMSEESDVAAGKISTTSPIGRALLNKKVGDTAVVVTPGGSREMEILKLSTMHDLAAGSLDGELESEAQPERETE